MKQIINLSQSYHGTNGVQITKQEEMLQSTYKKLQSAEFMTTAADDNEELMSLRHQSNLLKSDKVTLSMQKYNLSWDAYQ